MAPRKKPRDVEAGEVWAKIVSFRPKYYISRSGIADDCRIDDEAQLEVVAIIDAISAAQGKHVGQEMDISLLATESYTPREFTTPKFFGSVNMRGSHRSAMAYLPSAPFWALPDLICGRDAWVCFGWEPMHRGYGQLTSFFIGDAEDRRSLLELGGNSLVTET